MNTPEEQLIRAVVETEFEQPDYKAMAQLYYEDSVKVRTERDKLREDLAAFSNEVRELLPIMAEVMTTLKETSERPCDRIYGEYSGRHDPDCRKCKASTALAKLRTALELK